MNEVLAASDVQDEERVMVDLAQRFGITESYVLPHWDADNRQFAAALIGPGRPIDGIYRVAVHTLSSAFLLAALRIEASAVGGPEKLDRPALTIRQLQCLEWSRRGKSSADIGKILGLSPRTVDEPFAIACKALASEHGSRRCRGRCRSDCCLTERRMLPDCSAPVRLRGGMFAPGR